MFSYVYQIIGGILIFVSSLVGEDLPANWKKRSYFIFGALAIVYAGVGILLDRRTSSEQGKLQQSVSSLQASFESSEEARKAERDAAERARQSDRDAFLKQLNSLGNKLSDVRANVQTESLRKQLDETERSLHQTQQALEKREIKLDFLVNGRSNVSEASVSRQRPYPTSNMEMYVVAFSLVNNSDEDTGSGNAELLIICSDCGVRFARVDASYNFAIGGLRGFQDFLEIPKHSIVELGRLALYSPSSMPRQVRIGLRYRCLQCVPEEWRFVTLDIAD